MLLRALLLLRAPGCHGGLVQLKHGVAKAWANIDVLLKQRHDELPKLTKRELDALSWTAQGKTAWEVSVILGMSEKTVNFHLGNAMRKLQVSSKHQAVLKCVAAGVF